MMPLLVARRICGQIVWNAASADSTDLPGFNRPMMYNQDRFGFVNDPRSSSRSRGSIVSGIVTSAGTPMDTPWKSGGVTPTMVNGVPSMRSVFPMADGSAPKRRFHAA